MSLQKQLIWGSAIVGGLGLLTYYFSQKQEQQQQQKKEAFDIKNRVNALRLLKKLRKTYYKYHMMLAMSAQGMMKNPKLKKTPEEIETLLLNSPQFNQIQNSLTEKVFKYFNIDPITLNALKEMYQSDEEIIQKIKDIESQKNQAITGLPPSKFCTIPEDITIDVIKVVYESIMIETIEILRQEQLKFDASGKQITSQQQMAEFCMQAINETELKDRILEENGLENEDYEDSGEKILEAATMKFMSNPSFKEFLQQIEFKQMMGVNLALEQPNNKKELDQLMKEPISKAQMQQIMYQMQMMMQMQMQGGAGGPGGPGGPPGGNPFGGFGEDPMDGGMDMFGGGGGPQMSEEDFIEFMKQQGGGGMEGFGAGNEEAGGMNPNNLLEMLMQQQQQLQKK